MATTSRFLGCFAGFSPASASSLSARALLLATRSSASGVGNFSIVGEPPAGSIVSNSLGFVVTLIQLFYNLRLEKGKYKFIAH